MSISKKAGGALKTCKRKVCIKPSPRSDGLSPNFAVTVEDGKITNFDAKALFFSRVLYNFVFLVHSSQLDFWKKTCIKLSKQRKTQVQ
jgi:hypothetical protein